MEMTPSLLLSAYASGIFPMADDRHSTEVFWVDPEQRGIFPLDQFHVPRRLRKRLLRDELEITVDSDFPAVIDACASPAAGRAETWINPTIRELYLALHAAGHAHSIEVREQGVLIGGLYGVRLRAAFFGESMFSLGKDGSKIALVHTAARLAKAGFRLFDCQFKTDHLASFGCIEIERERYQRLLRSAVEVSTPWPIGFNQADLQTFVHPSTQTS